MNKTIKEHPDSYNGWTNYATWRVNLEILGDMDWYETEHVDADYLQELVENIVFDNYAQPKNGLMEDYARAFLNEVNYHEILEHILDEKEIEKQTENE
tara:strand:+ start:169 stop:462 length:294 start_codon:yes stop_codon:yes gene_type:complete